MNDVAWWFIVGSVLGLVSGGAGGFWVCLTVLRPHLREYREQADRWRDRARTFASEANKLAEKHGEVRVVGDGYFRHDYLH